ncbi:MAG TPA: hypothetical protein VFR39_03180, partial [Burkholderiales bacterium]|nr:hypothetical protein [Burkholderiales bacterium]
MASTAMQATRTSVLLFAFLLGVAAGSSAAQPGKDNAFTVYAAYRDGGSFTDISTGSRLPIEASAAWAASLDLSLDPRAGTQVQIYVSRQSSDVDARNATP